MNMFRFKKKGVTLVELLIVVLILAALSAIAIPRISQSATNAKTKACHTNLDVINSSIELYNADNSSGYPANLTTVTQDTDYFPDGEPKCPVLDDVYSDTLVNDRVNPSGHTPHP
jgi:general secretion pathway protein G